MIRTDVLKRWREHRMEDEIKEELIDQPLDGYSGPEGLVGPEGLLAELKKRLMNRVLDAELTAHLGRGKHAWANGGNVRSGRSGKTLRSDDGKLAIEVPRDRKGELEPALSGPGGPGRPGAPAWDAQGGGLAHAHPQRRRWSGRTRSSTSTRPWPRRGARARSPTGRSAWPWR